MSLSSRLRKIEVSLSGAEHPVFVFLDDESSFEITGFTFCGVNGSTLVERRPGENIESLKQSCRDAAMDALRSRPDQTKGIVFLAEYDFDQRRNEDESFTTVEQA